MAFDLLGKLGGIKTPKPLKPLFGDLLLKKEIKGIKLPSLKIPEYTATERPKPIGIRETLDYLPEVTEETIGKLSDVFSKGYKGVSNVKESFEEGWMRGVLSTGSVMERIASVGAKKVGFDEISEKLDILADKDKELAKTGIDITDARRFSEKVKDPNWIATGVGQNLPNMLVAMGAAIPAVIVGAGTLVVGGIAFVAAGLLEGGFAYEEALDFGVDEEKAGKIAGIVGIINGILETLPITKLLTRTPVGKNIKRSLIKEITKRVIRQTGLEAGTESIQEIVSNSVATTYDENRDLLAGVPEAGFFGGIMGGGVSTVMDVASITKPRGLTIEDVSEGKPTTIPKELEPLAKEARKHKSAEEFIERFQGGVIVDRGKFVELPIRGTTKVSKILTDFGKQQIKDLGLPDLTVKIKPTKGLLAAEAKLTIEEGKGLEGAFITINPSTIGVLDFYYLKNIEKNILHELTHARQIQLGRLKGETVKIAYKRIEKTADISAEFRYNKAVKDFYTQATKGVKEVKPEGIKLLTTKEKPYIIGEGFIAREGKKGLSPEVRVKREIAKYRKEIAEKKITEPLIARINKTKTRKDKIRIVRDFFKLTDADVKSISKKDVGLMSDFEFKNFIDDFRVKAEEYALKKQIEIENIEAGYKPTAKLVKPEAVPAEALSGFDNFINLQKIKRKDIPYKEMDIAELIRDDKTFPAIRQSGFFATKEIQTTPIRDVYDQFLAPYHMALKQDGYERGGKFGVMYKKVWIPTEKAIRTEKEFNVKNVKVIKDLGKKHNIKANKQNLEHLSDVIEKKVKATPNEEAYIKELREVLDDLRNQANEVREIMGKKKIGYITDYIPHIQKTTLWNELLSNVATISDNLDFIIPNQVKNPFAFKRMMEEMPKAERNLYILLDRYVSAIGKDIYVTPAIENIKAYNGVIKNRELFDASKYWDEYIRTGLIGKQHKLDTALSIGQVGKKRLVKWNDMINKAFLTGKVAWNVATQPLSFMMPGISEVGFINSVKAIRKSFDQPLRQYVRENSNVLSIKSSDVRAIAIGEGRNIQNRIYRTRIDKYNDVISVLGSVIERNLTMASYIAGLDKAKSLGYKGQDALMFADLAAARSQSMYNRENRALVLNSDIARTMFPFQSFSVEMFNHLKEVSTKSSGAMRLTYRQRFGKLFGLLIGIYLSNLYSELLTGKKKTTTGTFFPYVGNYIDLLISMAIGKEYYGGRSPITVIQISQDIIKGCKNYIEYGDIKKLRKVGVNFGLALGGIGGGGQINNLIDGIMASINEDVRNVRGNVMFRVEDTLSKIIAPIFGVWATKEGREYWQPKEKGGIEIPGIKIPGIKIPGVRIKGIEL